MPQLLDRWESHGLCHRLKLAIGPELSQDTLMFVPSGFQPCTDVDLIVFLHGKTMADDMRACIMDADHRGMLTGIAQTRKQVVLAAPYLGKDPQIARIGKFDDFLDQILEAMRENGFKAETYVDKEFEESGQAALHELSGAPRETTLLPPKAGTFQDKVYQERQQAVLHDWLGGPRETTLVPPKFWPPALHNLILSGHSAGGRPLQTIANMAHRYGSHLREVWCFDGWYWRDTAEQWWTFLGHHKTIPLYGYYTRGSLNNTAGPQIARLLYGYYTGMGGSLSNTAGPQDARPLRKRSEDEELEELLQKALKELQGLVKSDPENLPTTIVYLDGTPANGTLKYDPGDHYTEPARLIGGLVERSVNLHKGPD